MQKIFPTLFFIIVFLKTNAQQIDYRIQEVYGDKTTEIAQNEPQRIKALVDLLNNRIKIIESPVVGEDKYPKLSSVPLLNKYNPSLQRDLVFDPLKFNPLKYNFNFFSSKSEIYRVDNTNYLITISAQSFK